MLIHSLVAILHHYHCWERRWSIQRLLLFLACTAAHMVGVVWYCLKSQNRFWRCFSSHNVATLRLYPQLQPLSALIVHHYIRVPLYFFEIPHRVLIRVCVDVLRSGYVKHIPICGCDFRPLGTLIRVLFFWHLLVLEWIQMGDDRGLRIHVAGTTASSSLIIPTGLFMHHFWILLISNIFY